MTGETTMPNQKRPSSRDFVRSLSDTLPSDQFAGTTADMVNPNHEEEEGHLQAVQDAHAALYRVWTDIPPSYRPDWMEEALEKMMAWCAHHIVLSEKIHQEVSQGFGEESDE